MTMGLFSIIVMVAMGRTLKWRGDEGGHMHNVGVSVLECEILHIIVLDLQFIE